MIFAVNQACSLFGRYIRLFEKPHPEFETQHIAHSTVDSGFFDLSCLYGFYQPAISIGTQVHVGSGFYSLDSRIFQVGSYMSTGNAVNAGQVGINKSVESPAFAQQGVDQEFIGGAGNSVDAVVGSHDRSGFSYFYGPLESRKVFIQ